MRSSSLSCAASSGQGNDALGLCGISPSSAASAPLGPRTKAWLSSLGTPTAPISKEDEDEEEEDNVYDVVECVFLMTGGSVLLQVRKYQRMRRKCSLLSLN